MARTAPAPVVRQLDNASYGFFYVQPRTDGMFVVLDERKPVGFRGVGTFANEPAARKWAENRDRMEPKAAESAEP